MSTPPRPEGTQAARIIAITSGKGGVGKTNIAVNLGIALARSGRRTMLWDMDLGLANAHVLLGLSTGANLSQVLDGRKRVEEVMTEALGGLQVMPGPSGDEGLANLGNRGRQFLVNALERATRTSDYLLIDTGAGISDNVTRFTYAADEVIVVTNTEPTALLDAFASIKLTSHHNPEANIRLLINMARNDRDARHAMGVISNAAERFIHKPLGQEVYLPFDGAVSDAVRRRTPFIWNTPDSEVAKAVMRLAAHLIEGERTLTHMPRQEETERPGFIHRLLAQLAAA